MCNTIDTVEVCPICGNIKRITCAEIRCESNIHPIRDLPYNLTICKNYRELRNTTVADSNYPSSGDKLQELRDTTAESTKLSDVTEDILEDDHDPKDDSDSTISDISELNDTEMDLMIDILKLEIDQEYILVKRDGLQELVDAAAESTKLSDRTEVISEDDSDSNGSDTSEVSTFSDEIYEAIMSDLSEGIIEYDDQVFDSNKDDFLVNRYLCSTPEIDTRVRQLKREAMGLRWH
ncbi:hypothetical protein DID88_004043 [Monilinia fructigena]|uniref:Uncharacterized protein n=1 Tax=Monilinia fructigena TaxID=38457 RepID=A0A395ISW7_9HELO|nr:hypothetical protein DID88_004043 [Monilinia fructigena]